MLIIMLLDCSGSPHQNEQTVVGFEFWLYCDILPVSGIQQPLLFTSLSDVHFDVDLVSFLLFCQ